MDVLMPIARLPMMEAVEAILAKERRLIEEPQSE
jgi:hypothetical protein